MLQLSKAFMKKKEKMIFINEMIVRIIKKIFRKASRNYQLKNETGLQRGLIIDLKIRKEKFTDNNKKTKTLGKELVTTFESFHEKEKEDDFYNEDDCTN